MINGRMPEKARIMVDYLCERISTGAYKPGMKIESIRDLQDRFNISFSSAKRGIDYLCSLGLAEKRPRSGVYVSLKRSTEASSNHQISVAICLRGKGEISGRGVYATVFLGIQRFAEEKGCAFSVRYIPLEEANEDTFKLMAEKDDAAILLGEYDTVIDEASFKVPVVGVCMHDSMSGALSLIDIDPYQSAKLAVSHFQGLSLKTIRVVGREKLPQAYHNRINEFIASWKSAGGDIVEVKDMEFESLSNSKTGYFFPNGSCLQTVSERFFKETGKILSKQAIVLGIDGKNLINPNFHKAPTVALDWQLAGHVAMEECLRRIENPGSLPRRIYLPGRLEGCESS